ncbi:MAG: amino acid racemase [Clostridia bacterium]|nr:amino acid racemase [Clostridia bacterium]
MSRKMLGIIGGMGPAATDLLYRRIIDRTDAECDQEHIDMVILNHASMPDRTEAIKSGNTEKVISLLRSDLHFLKNAGCEVVAIPCNTSHYFLSSLKADGTEVMNMVRLTSEYVKKLGRKKVAVLATDGTIGTGLYEKELNRAGVEYVAPDGETQKIVMKIIYDQIKKGFPGREEDFMKIHHFIKNQGCDGAILACTELSVFRDMAGLTDFYTDALEVLTESTILACGAKLKETV